MSMVSFRLFSVCAIAVVRSRCFNSLLFLTSSYISVILSKLCVGWMTLKFMKQNSYRVRMGSPCHVCRKSFCHGNCTNIWLFIVSLRHSKLVPSQWHCCNNDNLSFRSCEFLRVHIRKCNGHSYIHDNYIINVLYIRRSVHLLLQESAPCFVRFDAFGEMKHAIVDPCRAGNQGELHSFVFDQRNDVVYFRQYRTARTGAA